MKFPSGKDFIFTVLDDTDVSTLGNIKPVYDFLTETKIFTTKTVWPCSFDGQSAYAGSHTLEDKDYADYVRELSDRGFEIAYHGASMESSTRDKILLSFKIYHDIFGSYPRTYAAHSGNRDNLYWGVQRFNSPFIRFFYRKFIYKDRADFYSGHDVNSVYYWGDIAKNHISYTRNLTYNSINLLNISSNIVYKDNNKPLLNNLFITADAENVEDFCALISKENQDRLEKQRGICILSTHFGKGFVDNGHLHPRARLLIESLSKRNGWFAPVCEVLDYLSSINQGIPSISRKDLFNLERKWLFHALVRRVSYRNYKRTETPYLLASARENSRKTD
jgi:hypothetical protein